MTHQTEPSAADRDEMRRRGWVTYLSSVSWAMARAVLCPFCLTKCRPFVERKGFPNEQNSEYHCGNREAIK